MNKSFYLPGLNGIRAIAALIVLLFHIDQYMYYFKIPSMGFHSTGMAGYGVVLFFVLSGFLITYLLILEKDKFQKIDLKKFYIRRIMRIWPLYYFIILIAIIIVISTTSASQFLQNYSLTFSIYSLMLANVGFGLGLGFTTIYPLWSIGVEEQFYLFWPILLSRFKNIAYSLVGVILIYLAIKLALRFTENSTIYSIWWHASFDCMAIGGLGAFLVANKKSKFLNIIYNKAIQIFAWLILFTSIVYKPLEIFTFINFELHALVYVIIIMNVSSNPNSLIKLEYKIFNFIGRISFGIYAYHVTIILLLSFLTDGLELSKSNTFNYFGIYFLVVILTLFVAFISNKYFESYFLHLKEKFSKIRSTNIPILELENLSNLK